MGDGVAQSICGGAGKPLVYAVAGSIDRRRKGPMPSRIGLAWLVNQIIWVAAVCRATAKEQIGRLSILSHNCAHPLTRIVDPPGPDLILPVLLLHLAHHAQF